MAPLRGSSPPPSPSMTSSIGSTSTPLPPQDYAHIVRSIQRRSVDRLSEDHSVASWKVRTGSSEDGGPGEGHAEGNSLEGDLKLAAEIGVALLHEKGVLQQRLEQMERANQKLLTRLSSSVKENDQLQRVRAFGNGPVDTR